MPCSGGVSGLAPPAASAASSLQGQAHVVRACRHCPALPATHLFFRDYGHGGTPIQSGPLLSNSLDVQTPNHQPLPCPRWLLHPLVTGADTARCESTKLRVTLKCKASACIPVVLAFGRFAFGLGREVTLDSSCYQGCSLIGVRHTSGVQAGRRDAGTTEDPFRPRNLPQIGRAMVGPSPLPCSDDGCLILETLGPSTAHLALPGLSLLPSSFSGLRWKGGPHEVARVTRVRVHRARRAVPGPPMGDGAGQGPTGSPLAPPSTEKYLPRVGGGLVGLARKGRGGGKATESPALAMY